MPVENPRGSERKGARTTGRPWGRGEAPSEAEGDLRQPDVIRAEEHVRLARKVLVKTIGRPDADDLGNALLGLSKAAAEWNAGKRPCPWPTFAWKQVEWAILARYGRLVSSVVISGEVDLFLRGEDELERPELAVEDPGFQAAACRADAGALLAGLGPRERFVLERRFGLRGEAATLKEIGEELGIGREGARKVEAKGLRTLRRLARVRLEEGPEAAFLRRLEGKAPRRARPVRLPGRRRPTGTNVYDSP